MSFAPTGRLAGRDALGLARLHVLAIMALAAVLFGWLFDGRFGLVAGALAAFDWLLAGLFNRIADVPEDRRNGVPGAAYVERNAGALMRIVFLALAVSLIGARPLGTPLLIVRCGFHAGAFAYSFPTVVERLKEKFLIKNLVAALLAVVSAVGYPLALRGSVPAQAAWLCGFVLPLGISYGLIYDLRDAGGDAACGLVTLPVKWGPGRTRAAIALLLALSAAALVAGYLLGAVPFGELMLIAAPAQLALVLVFWIPRRVTARDAAAITWLGAAQLASCLAWLALRRAW